MTGLVKQFKKSKMIIVTEEEARHTFLTTNPLYDGKEVVVIAVSPTYKGNLIIEYLFLKDYEDMNKPVGIP